MKTVIIVPTYNERENIQRLIPALLEQFARMDHDMHILVVDDNSPDDTAGAVRALQEGRPNVHLIVGQKAGLDAAYTRGMTYALGTLNADAG